MKDHRFVDAEDIVVVQPRTKTRREVELEQWSTFVVRPYHDAFITQVGYDLLTSLYVEWFWLPVMGPSCFVMARNLLRRDPGEEVVLAELGPELGLNESSTLHTLSRLQRFNVVLRTSSTVLVRTHLAPISVGALLKLPESMQQAHEYYEEPGA